MAGRVVCRGGVALRLHVLSQGRALPLAWRVRQGPKGHVPEEWPSALVHLRRVWLPAGAQGVLRGDGECAGTTRQETRNEAGWCEACRTAQSPVAPGAGETLGLEAFGAWSEPGPLRECREVKSTRDASGPVMGLSGWAKGSQEPLYVVRNRDAAEEACRYAQKRF